MQKIKLWIATANKGKAEEFKLLLKEHRLYFLKDLAGYKSPEETGKSFKENARIKARALRDIIHNYKTSGRLQLKPVTDTKKERTKQQGIKVHSLSRSWGEIKKERTKQQDIKDYWILGEDSGLKAPALQNAPGVYSARYAGAQATDKDNLQLLLKNMKAFSGKERTAFFISHIIALSPKGKEYSFEGRLEGLIARTPKGKAGFGYDPVFIPKGKALSLAQLGMEYKNRFSHRAQAVEKMKKRLKKPLRFF